MRILHGFIAQEVSTSLEVPKWCTIDLPRTILRYLITSVNCQIVQSRQHSLRQEGWIPNIITCVDRHTSPVAKVYV
uniref:Uncharacterized protein n=1 Tax=Hyaloperonospora arabidopsidis (strain Emoy2) TaxID=559515 RepID=M4BJ03_HYAAE